MSDAKDAVDSLKQGVLERLASPLPGSFVIAWLIWNWKVVFFTIFNAGTAIERIQFIESHNNAIDFEVIPLAAAVFFILLHPPLRNLIDIYQSRFRRKMQERSIAEVERGIEASIVYADSLRRKDIFSKQSALNLSEEKLDAQENFLKQREELLNKRDYRLKLLTKLTNSQLSSYMESIEKTVQESESKKSLE